MSTREPKSRSTARPAGHPREPKSRASARTAEGRHRLPDALIAEVAGATAEVAGTPPYEGRHRRAHEAGAPASQRGAVVTGLRSEQASLRATREGAASRKPRRRAGEHSEAGG